MKPEWMTKALSRKPKQVHPTGPWHAKAASQDASAISWAAEQGHIGILRAALHAQGDKTSDYTAALLLAADRNHHEVVHAVLDHAMTDTVRGRTGLTALTIAAEKGHVDVVKALLEHGIADAMRGRSGWTALMIAAEKGNLEVVRLLVGADAGRDVIGASAWESICLMAEDGNSELLKALATQEKVRNVDVSAIVSALTWATEQGLVEVVRSLLCRMDIANTSNSREDAVMSWAVVNGHVEVIGELVKVGIAPEDYEGWNRLILAAFESGHPDVVKTLLSYRSKGIDEKSADVSLLSDEDGDRGVSCSVY